MAKKTGLSRKDFLRLLAAAAAAAGIYLLYPLVKALSPARTPEQDLSPIPTRAAPTATPTPAETSSPSETPTNPPTSSPPEKNPNLLTAEKIQFLADHPINHGRTEEKIVMMTYDEGNIPENVEKLLDIYKNHDGKCTFFMTGAGLEQSKGLLARMINEGHVVGSHSYDHINLAELTDDKITEQFNKWFDKFRSIIPDYQVNYFRAPSGSKNERVLKIASSFGLQHVHWNVSSGGLTADTIKYVFDEFQRYQNYYQAVGGAIVLSHTIRSYDISQADDIVTRWIDLGYQLITIDQGKMDSDTWKG